MTIYLDYNATAPLSPAARTAWLAAQDEAWGNPGSIHAIGQIARHRADQAKALIARHLGCAAGELVVTSGGSESNATAINAALAVDGNAVCSTVDHSSVLRNAERPQRPVMLIGVDADGRIDPATIHTTVDAKTRLLCIQFANNEIGTLYDVPALAAAARAINPAIWVHCDAAQGPGKTPIDLRALGVDSVAIAGHKFGAPKGVGLLWLKPGRVLPPLIAGGKQQQDRRSGTEDAALISALAAALDERMARMAGEDERQRRILDACFADIQSALPKAQWIARAAPRIANTLSLAHPGVINEALLMRLDLAGYAVSRGAACMAARGQPSHVIASLGLPRDLALSVIRISIGPNTTSAELMSFAQAYVQVVKEMVKEIAA